MKTCGNCGIKCTGRTGPRDRAACADWTGYEPTELQRAQWWFCGWRRAGGKYVWLKYRLYFYSASERLFKAIRANAGKE